MGTRDENNELWNFDDEDKREVIREYVKTHKPLLVIGSHVQAVVERLGQEAAKKRVLTLLAAMLFQTLKGHRWTPDAEQVSYRYEYNTYR